MENFLNHNKQGSGIKEDGGENFPNHNTWSGWLAVTLTSKLKEYKQGAGFNIQA